MITAKLDYLTEAFVLVTAPGDPVMLGYAVEHLPCWCAEWDDNVKEPDSVRLWIALPPNVDMSERIADYAATLDAVSEGTAA